MGSSLPLQSLEDPQLPHSMLFPCLCLYMCEHACTYASLGAHVFRCMHVCKYMSVCLCVCVHVCVCMCVHVSSCIEERDEMRKIILWRCLDS